MAMTNSTNHSVPHDFPTEPKVWNDTMDDGRIIGGQRSKKGSWPFMAHIDNQIGYFSGYKCAGVVCKYRKTIVN